MITQSVDLRQELKLDLKEINCKSFTEDMKAYSSISKDVRVVVFGPPNSGKSTLINTLSPSLDLKTANISVQHEQGQHTTTYAEMFDLEGGAKLIDTPGIRGFGVFDIRKEELSGYFVEFSKLVKECKFNNCMHINEPQCAVKKALGKGEIAYSRYKSYLQLLEDDILYR